ncbi:Plasmodium exported protein (Pm-fam-a like), unknown function [Plasmodium malariae]|uniref:Fam-l protein n=1 Tax=Plasmodium malariae TaxID=5858 RepID=A0A1A8X3Y4_PLAMA|nr:Plasmodium exported protein (Pm-fam-a like), unknown function [Plasmodium malariae]
MEQKTTLLFFIKISIFINWIYNITHDISSHNSAYCKKNNNISKLVIKNYRLLAKYKKDKYSNFIQLKEEAPGIAVKKEKDIYINEGRMTGKKKQQNGSSMNNLRGHKHPSKSKSYTFETKYYSNMEKKIFKELDYEDFLKNNKTVSNKTYTKLIRKKYGLRLALPLILFLLLFITLITDLLWSCGIARGLSEILNKINPADNWRINLREWLLKTPPFSWLLKSAENVRKIGDNAGNLFITIKKLKNSKKSNLGDDNMNRRNYISFYSEIINIK